MSISQGYYDTSYPPSLWADSTVTTVNPATAAVGAAPFAITVNGTGFTAGSVVSFDGDPRPTTFVSDTQLTAGVASPVGPARTVQVSVSTGGSSPFIITATAEELGQTSSATGVARTVAPDSPQVPQDSPGDPGGTETAQEPPEAPEAS